MLRLQTFYILITNGAKVKRPTDLWKLKSDVEDTKALPFKYGTTEYKEWYSNLKKIHKFK